jgi:hypothetical protein
MSSPVDSASPQTYVKLRNLAATVPTLTSFRLMGAREFRDDRPLVSSVSTCA